MLKRFPILIGFAGSMLFFLAVNLYACLVALGNRGGHSVAEAGFPFRWYTTGWVAEPHIDWDALSLNVSVALVTGLVAGIVIRPVFHPDSSR
jgi:hypothetical protein